MSPGNSHLDVNNLESSSPSEDESVSEDDKDPENSSEE